MEDTTQNMESNMSKLDTRTQEERQADAELATMVKLETRSYTLRRQALESELAELHWDGTPGYVARDVKVCRRLIAECDKALMVLASGRLP
jgi:hypothetical protein